MKTSGTLHHVKGCRVMIVRYSTISCIATRFLNMTENRQDVVLGPRRTTSHDYARFTPDGPRSPNLRQSQVVVRCLNVRCDHRLRYLKFNARHSHNVVRGRTTIAQDLYEKAVRCLSLIFSGENMSKCRMNSYDVVR